MSTQKNENNPEPELKPCPFCGSPAECDQDESACLVTCSNDDCQLSGLHFVKANEWNRRITPPPDPTGIGREGVHIWRESDELVIMQLPGMEPMRLTNEGARTMLHDLMAVAHGDPLNQKRATK